MSDAAEGVGLHIALKSGNFGTDDFFSKAFIHRMTVSPHAHHFAASGDEPVQVCLSPTEGWPA
jgi:hypothetical protein